MLKPRFSAISGFVLFAALLRLIPHPWNFSPIGAMALFAGAKFENRRAAFLFPLAAMLLSDLALGAYRGMSVVYLSFALIVVLGRLLKQRPGLLPLAGGTLAASVSFFLITNFGVWALTPLYPKTPAGLTACYVAGIPFFRNTLAGDACYVVLLFGGFALAEKWFPALREIEGQPIAA